MGTASSSQIQSAQRQSIKKSKVDCQSQKVDENKSHDKIPQLGQAPATASKSNGNRPNGFILNASGHDNNLSGDGRAVDSVETLSKVKEYSSCETPLNNFTGSSVVTSGSNSNDDGEDKTDISSSSNAELFVLREKIKRLEVDLAKTCSKNLDLEDRVQSLKELLDSSKNLAVISEEPEVVDDAKNTLIENLQTEIDNIKSESQKLRVKNKRRVKMLTAKLTEVQQNAQLQKLEMIEEINQLKDLNKDLNVQLKNSKKQGEFKNDDLYSPVSDRTNLVVELSAQVSEQSQIITDLRDELKEKQEQIDVLSKPQFIGELTNRDHVCMEKDTNCKIISPHPPSSASSSHRSTRKKSYKIGQKRIADNSDRQLAFIKTVNDVISDSDSDWTNDIVSSKIHSAPSAVRTELAY